MKNGPYIMIVPPVDYTGKRYRDRYAYEHIVEFWKREGRLPKDGYVIHHKNGNKHDNSWDNLEEITPNDHNKLHASLAPKKPINHGTLYGYLNKKCRCKLCRKAKANNQAAYRKKYGRKKGQ